jgi:hypothetical protein
VYRFPSFPSAAGAGQLKTRSCSYKATHVCTLVRETPNTRAASALHIPCRVTAPTARRRKSSLPTKSNFRASCFIFIHVYTTQYSEVFSYSVSE